MTFHSSDSMTEKEKREVFSLWNNEFPSNLKKETMVDFQKFFDDVEEHHFIMAKDDYGKLAGWFFIFLREGAKWFSILIDASFHGQGLGSELIKRAKKVEPELNGWVVDRPDELKNDGSPYPSPIPFYIKNGFEVLPDRLEKEDISAVKVRWRMTK